MSKHIIDHPVPHDDTQRTEAFRQIDRKRGPEAEDERVKTMLRRPRTRSKTARSEAYMDLERTRED